MLPDVEPCQLMGGDIPSCIVFLGKLPEVEPCHLWAFNVMGDGSSWDKEAHLAAKSTTVSVSLLMNLCMEQLTAAQGAGFLDW